IPIPAGEVVAGDSIKGYSFKTSQDVYRKVVQTSRQSCAAWRMVDGHRVSPCEAVYHDAQWQPAFRVKGATVESFVGTKVLISLQSDEFDEQNFWLTGAAPLLIHNNPAGGMTC